jgi:gliding motility-associated-like protein
MRGLVQNMTRLMVAALLPLLLALAPAKAETVVYVGTTSTLEVVQYPGDTYVWDLYNDSTVNFATTPGAVPAASAAFVGGNTGPKVTVAWNQQGIYFFRVMARNASNCTNNLKVGKIKVVPIPVDAVISGANLIGACEQVKLDATKSIGDIVKYEWSVIDPGGAVTRTTGIDTEFLLSPSYGGKLPEDFRVMLKVTNRTGQTDTDTITVKIDPKPIAGITSSLQPQKDGSMLVDGSTSVGTGLTYRWSTAEGKIVGAADQPAAYLLGAGMYTLEVIDIHGCISVKSFRFPIELYDIQARPDYARTSWAEDTTVVVLANDNSTAGLIPGSVHVIKPPSRGETRVNPDGTITYTPSGRISGRDEFTYEVCDIVNLCDSALVTIDIYDAGLKVPEAFSPNGDGLNEHLVFTGLEHYPQSHLHVYTRSGQLVYASSDYLNDWDGSWIKSNLTNNGKVPTGVYYYVLELGGVNRTIKGFVYIGY